MQQRVKDAWTAVERSLGDAAGSLKLRPPTTAARITKAEKKLKVSLPEDYKAWLTLHDGEDHSDERIEWMPAGGRLLPLDTTLERWEEEQEYAQEADEDTQDDDRILNVVRHPKRIVIAGNQWGDGDNTYLDLIPGPKGTPGQVIVATTECDFEVVGTSFVDFLERCAAAISAGVLSVQDSGGTLRVDLVDKPDPSMRWEAALRNVRPLP